jgi:hypothetical protein
VKALDRRTVLKGLVGGSAVLVGLPTLEAMLGPNGDALASGAPLPDRFGVWFWGNGVKPDRWVPTGTGPWTPSEELQPLADLVPYVSVVSGCEIKTATHPHHSGMTGILTGQHYLQLGTTRDTIVSTFARQSVDQDAADRLGTTTVLRSLEVGITRFRGTDEGSTFEHVSHNGPNNPNPAPVDPAVVFRRLFGGTTDPARIAVRSSVLDVVSEQATRLRARLGSADRARLDQHLESVRGLEQRLQAVRGACTVPDEPVQPADESREAIEERNGIMSELVALALACDLTRVFTVQFSSAGAGVVVWEVGATDSHHLTCHVEPEPQPVVHAVTTFVMGRLGDFLRTLRDTPEGDGNLLDRCSILATTELCEGSKHSNTDFPILVAGKGSGRLRGGVHWRSTTADNTSRAVLTALHGAGVALPSWGVDAGRAVDPVGELLV